jgi:hypothetical protein
MLIFLITLVRIPDVIIIDILVTDLRYKMISPKGMDKLFWGKEFEDIRLDLPIGNDIKRAHI